MTLSGKADASVLVRSVGSGNLDVKSASEESFAARMIVAHVWRSIREVIAIRNIVAEDANMI